MAIRNYQRAFNGGEVSPSMFARIDDGKYQTGLAQCKNFLIEPQGPIVMRPGFKYVNHTKHAGKKARLIPFNFSISQTMVLEFGERYVRFHTQGQTVLGNNGQPYEIETPYLEADLFDIHYVQSADVMTLVHPNYPPKELRRYGATDWRLVDIRFGSSLSAPTGLSASQTINKDVTNPTDYKRTYAVTALLADGTEESVRSSSVTIDCNPYGDGSYNTIKWNAVVGAGLYRVYRDQGGVWAYVGQTDTTQIIDENITPDASITPPHYDDAFYSSKGITSVRVNNGGSGYLADRRGIDVSQWSLKDGGDFGKNGKLKIESVDRFATIECRVYDETGAGTGATVTPIIKETKVKDRTDSFGDGNYNEFTNCISEITGFTVTNPGSGYSSPRIELKYSFIAKYTQYRTSKAIYSVGVEANSLRIVVSDSTGFGADLVPGVENGRIVSVTIRSGGQNYSSPSLSVVSTTGSGASLSANVGQAPDYPGAVSYFEQRRWFGGTQNRPNNLWATRPGTEADMSFSLPSQSDDRIAVRVAAREANRILHIVPLAQLMLMTGAAEWRVSPLNSDAITPESMSVRPQSYVGASNVQPLVIGSSMIYGAGRGGHLRELGYNYEAGGYISGDVCLRAPHLFDNLTIVDLAYSKAPSPVVWAVSSSGKMIAMTYVPEQQVGGFSTVETKGAIESVCVVAEGDEDIVYVEVLRTVNGQTVRFVERMTERQYTDLKECVYVDCAGTYRGEAKTEITGLTWLEGETVSILADGAVEPQQVVKDGKITLTYPAEIVHVGLPFTADMKTLPVAMALQDGSYGSGHKKNVREVFFRVVNSSGTQAGPSFEKLSEYPSRSTEFAGNVPDPITDEIGFQIQPQWSQSGQVCVRQKYPLPLRIVSMTTVLELS
uniref:Stabilization protein n=1 Tax=Podoviridae sp. cta463 TaxID=2826561 RepID=A0A8S5QSP3_9CAUD|nr:MAG TPA: stabilization protein [Podoviridae sp. cta463]